MASAGGPRPGGHERAVGTSERVYRSLLRAYPRGLREEYGEEMVSCFRDLCREKLEDGGGPGLAALWARTLPELFYTALKERSTMLAGNLYRAVVGVALATASILLIPLLTAPAWSLADFVVAGALIFGTGLTYALVARKAGNMAYRAAVGVALAAALLLVWINLAVGVIGTEDELANLMYVGVLFVGIVGAIVARFRPDGMARVVGGGARSGIGRRDRVDRRVGPPREPAAGDLGREWVLRHAVRRIGVADSVRWAGAKSRRSGAVGLTRGDVLLHVCSSQCFPEVPHLPSWSPEREGQDHPRIRTRLLF
jgi:hypothetical protein